jgi:hypothetical protein
MQINWEAVGAIGEIVGAIAVFATLVYLARQMRQSNELLRAQARSVFLQNRERALQALYENDELVESMQKAGANQELTSLESKRLELYYRSIYVLWDWEYEQYTGGLLAEPPETRFKTALNYYPLLRENWPKHKVTLSPQFTKYFEANVLN